MKITVQHENANTPITVIRVEGIIDSTTYQEFQSKAEECIAQGARRLLIDMSGVPHISSAGLRAMHAIFNQLRALHKDVDDDSLRKQMSTGAYKSPYLKVCTLSNEARRAFDLGGFDTYIEVHADAKSALNSF